MAELDPVADRDRPAAGHETARERNLYLLVELRVRTITNEAEMETNRVAGREGAQPDSGAYLASARPLQRPFSSHPFGAALSGRCGASERSDGGEPRLSCSSSHSIPDRAV